jgi:hypothetical protein
MRIVYNYKGYYGSRKRNNTATELVVAQLRRGGVLAVGIVP